MSPLLLKQSLKQDANLQIVTRLKLFRIKLAVKLIATYAFKNIRAAKWNLRDFKAQKCHQNFDDFFKQLE